MKCGRCATSHLLERRTNCEEKRHKMCKGEGPGAGGGQRRSKKRRPAACSSDGTGRQGMDWNGCRWVGSEQGIEWGQSTTSARGCIICLGVGSCRAPEQRRGRAGRAGDRAAARRRRAGRSILLRVSPPQGGALTCRASPAASEAGGGRVGGGVRRMASDVEDAWAAPSAPTCPCCGWLSRAGSQDGQ